MSDQLYKKVTIANCKPGFIASGAVSIALNELGYEGFVEEENRLEAYISSAQFNASALTGILKTLECGGEYSIDDVSAENWQNLWQESHKPITITTTHRRLRVRAAFHPPGQGVELVIKPQMAFGTGQHATTRLMLERLLDMDISRLSILDIGTGTGILALAASKFNARAIIAIDNDPMAIENARQNARENNIKRIEFIQGGFEVIPKQNFDLILANLTFDLLSQEMLTLKEHLAERGTLIASGFTPNEAPALKKIAIQHGLRHGETFTRAQWCCSQFYL